jgi:hypothetical protein
MHSILLSAPLCNGNTGRFLLSCLDCCLMKLFRLFFFVAGTVQIAAGRCFLCCFDSDFVHRLCLLVFCALEAIKEAGNV